MSKEFLLKSLKESNLTLPQKDKIALCLEGLCFLLFPEHCPAQSFVQEKTKEEMLEKVWSTVRQELLAQISLALRCPQTLPVQANRPSLETLVDQFLDELSEIREKLFIDAKAACDRDPAVESLDEVILCYPGFQALMTYRIAHALAKQNVPFLPRMMSEIAHAKTGCDIHPEAKIGEGLFIDHATGVVIGQTSVVGDRVTIFQGVTLGSIAMQGKTSTGQRHPTIEDDVVLYSNATILGGDTVIGKKSVIGGSCWITFSVPPHCKVILANPRSLITQKQTSPEFIPNWDI